MEKLKIEIPENCTASLQVEDNMAVVVFEPKKYEPKEGDVVVFDLNDDERLVLFYTNKRGNNVTTGYNIALKNQITPNNFGLHLGDEIRPATESEKQLLFNDIDQAGYVWDADKLELVKKRWKPGLGYDYYRIFSNGVRVTIWSDDKVDKNSYELGNCYQTEAQAQEAWEQIKLIYAKNL